MTRPPGYALDARPEQVDAQRFRGLVRRGRAELAAGDAATALSTLGEALDMWRGEPFAEFAHLAFAAGERTALEELRLAAVEDRVQAELATGAGPELVAEVEAVVGEHRLRERLWGQLMVALYRSGRQADALAAYQRARRVLVDELGVEPGPELRDLEARVLAHDPSLLAEPTPAPVLPTPLAAVGPTFVGREHELRLLVDSLEHAESGHVVRILVVGPHGIGKTRLLAEVGRLAFERGATVRYARGDGPAPEGTTGGLVVWVYDDLHEASVASLESLGAGVEATQPPALLLFAVVESELSQAQRFLVRPLADVRLQLRPLATDEVATLVRLYVPDAQLPDALVEMQAAGGVPLEVHDRASRWAEEWAARKVGGAAAGVPATGEELSVARGDIADGVVDLRRVRAQRAAHAPDREVVVCPYKGLSAFDTSDAPYFFGRDRLTAELVARLVGSSLLAVVGPSGSGKSSVVRAGLLPALSGGVLPGSDRWTVVVTTPHGPPPRVPDDRRSVVVVDQFEELFTTLTEGERQEYVAWLMSVLSGPAGTASVVLTLRADYYGHCAEHPELARHVSANTVLVPPMTADELRAAVEEPARAAGLFVEPGVADAVIEEAGQEPGALPLVSTGLLSLWERRQGRRLTLAAYRESGGVSGAVAQLAETTYAALSPGQQLVARRTLLRLGDIVDAAEVVRRRVPIAEVAPPGDDDARVVLDMLASRRLLTVSGDTVEVSHEALLREWPRLRSWLEEDEVGRALRSHLAPAAREWEKRGHDESELYRGPRLVAALDWAHEHDADLTGTEQAFLQQSRAAADRDAHRKRQTIRRLRYGAAGLAALLVIATGAGFLAVVQRDRAHNASLASDIKALEAKAAASERWDLALLYNAQAQRLQGDDATGLALLQTLQRSPQATAVINAPERLLLAALSPDGSLLVSGDRNGQLYAWDTDSRVPRTMPAVKTFPSLMTFSPDGRTLMVSGGSEPGDPSVYLIDLTSDDAEPRALDPGGVLQAAFLGSGTTAVGLFEDGALRTIDASTRRVGPAWPLPRDLGDVGVGLPRNQGGVGLGSDAYLSAVTNGIVHVTIPGHTLMWNGATTSPVAVVSVERAVLAPDGSNAAFGLDDGRVGVVHMGTQAQRLSATVHDGPVSLPAWSPNSSLFATSAHDHTVRVWDVSTLEPAAILRGHRSKANTVAFAPDGQTLYSASLDRSAFVWDLSGQRGFPKPFGRPRDVKGLIGLGSVSLDGGLVAEVHDDNSLEVVVDNGVSTVTIRPEPPIDVEVFNDVSVDPTGRWVAFLLGEAGLMEGRSRLGHVFVFDVERRVFLPYVLHPDLVPCDACGPTGAVTFSPDGSTLYTASAGSGVVQAWNTEAGTGGDVVYDVADRGALGWLGRPTPTGLLPVLSYRADEAFTDIVDLSTQQAIATLPTPAPRGVPPVLSTDGRRLAIGEFNGTVSVWDVPGQRLVRRLFVTDGWVNSLAYSPDGRFLMAGAGDGKVTIWPADEGLANAAVLDAWQGQVLVYAAFRDSRRIVTIPSNGRPQLWNIAPDALLERACDITRRDLSQEEWDAVLPDRPYERTCTDGTS